MLEDARVVEAVDDRGVGFDASHQIVEPVKGLLERRAEHTKEIVRKIEARAARDQTTPKEPIAGELLVYLLEALLQTHAGGGAIVERRAGAHVANVTDMVVQPLQFQRDTSEEAGARRHVDAGNLLKGLTVPEAVGNRAHPADTLGHIERVERREPLHALLQP